MGLNSEEAGGVAIVAVPTVCLLGMCVARGGDFTGLGDALPVLGVGAAILAGVGAVWALASGVSGGAARSRQIVVHHEARHVDGNRQLAARHEAGHIVMAQRVGCRVMDARIYPDGSGYTAYMVPSPLYPGDVGHGVISDVAISVAGEVASGTTVGCGSDHRQRDRTLASIGWGRRSWVRDRAYSMARRTVGTGWLGGAPSKVGRYERRLMSRGRL